MFLFVEKQRFLHKASREARNVCEPPCLFPLHLSQVCLVPQSLARKRLWNKKYPICIELAKQDDFMSKAEGERPEVAETGGAQDRGSAPTSRDVTLYLFGRTGREKEEWFQRLLAASRLKLDSRKASRAAASRSGKRNRRCLPGRPLPLVCPNSRNIATQMELLRSRTAEHGTFPSLIAPSLL